MSGFRLKLNRLRNIPYASSLQESLPFDQAFEVEYVFAGEWSDIEKESTGETEAIGWAIEKYYSTRYLLSTPSHLLN